MLNNKQKKKILDIAKQTVESYILTGNVLDFKVVDEGLNKKQGAFVTIRCGKQLRGCVGQIVPTNKPLWQVVRNMAISASSEDLRFNPIAKTELAKLSYEISVLSVPEKISDWQNIELGKHGVIVQQGYNCGVFLPQVADETGWSKEEFLSHLCENKAGLPAKCYKNKDILLSVFTAQVFARNA
ncbi:MAG: AmmeMemoRadiSam system protein A [Patescibacteria group bacterium]